MKYKLLYTQQEIAKRAGLSQQYISRIINGDRQPTVETAYKLQRATSFCRESWLFPERHWNPYIPFNRKPQCMRCLNRVERVRWITNRATRYLKQTEDKINTLNEIMNELVYLNGYINNNVSMGFRKMEDEYFKHIASSNFVEDDIWGERDIPKNKIPYIVELFEKQTPLIAPVIYEMDDSPDREMLIQSGVKAILGIPVENWGFGIISYEYRPEWNDLLINTHIGWTRNIAEILKEDERSPLNQERL